MPRRAATLLPAATADGCAEPRRRAPLVEPASTGDRVAARAAPVPAAEPLRSPGGARGRRVDRRPPVGAARSAGAGRARRRGGAAPLPRRGHVAAGVRRCTAPSASRTSARSGSRASVARDRWSAAACFAYPPVRSAARGAVGARRPARVRRRQRRARTRRAGGRATRCGSRCAGQPRPAGRRRPTTSARSLVHRSIVTGRDYEIVIRVDDLPSAIALAERARSARCTIRSIAGRRARQSCTQILIARRDRARDRRARSRRRDGYACGCSWSLGRDVST